MLRLPPQLKLELQLFHHCPIEFSARRQSGTRRRITEVTLQQGLPTSEPQDVMDAPCIPNPHLLLWIT